jgi:hypothetical protein
MTSSVVCVFLMTRFKFSYADYYKPCGHIHKTSLVKFVRYLELQDYYLDIFKNKCYFKQISLQSDVTYNKKQKLLFFTCNSFSNPFLSYKNFENLT